MTAARVLIVEDNNLVALAITHTLRRQGYEPIGDVATGEEAVLRAVVERPDVVLMDIALEGAIDGIEAAAQIQEQAGIPIVYLTAHGDDATLQRAKLSGPWGYVLKPFAPRDLHIAVDLALYKHASEQALRRARDELELRVQQRTAQLSAANAALECEIAERRNAEESLRASERRFRAMIEKSADITALVDTKGVVTYMSASVEQVLGYAVADLMGTPAFDLVHHGDRAAASELVARVFERPGYDADCECRNRHRDGSWRWIHATVTNLLAEPAVGALVVNFRDITERRAAEEAARRTEERYRDLFEEAPVMYVITRDQDGLPIVTDCNRAFLATLGYSREEVVGRLLTEFYTPDSRARLLDGGYRQALAGNLGSVERGLVTRAGRVVETLVTARAEDEAGGHAGGVRAAFLDITARKEAERALEQSEQRFRRLADHAADIIYRIELVPHPRLAYLNPAAGALTGYPVEELSSDLDRLLSLIHPDDRPVLETALQGLGGSGEPVVVRWSCRDGRVMWAEHRNVHLRDAGGHPIAVEGIARDITRRKWAEQVLQQSEERYRRRSSELEALHRISLRLNRHQAQGDLHRLIVEQAAALLDAPVAALYLHGADPEALQFVQGVGAPPDGADRMPIAGERPASRAYCSRQPVLAQESLDAGGGDGAVAQLAVPLVGSQATPGVLLVCGAHGRRFNEHDVWLIGLFAAQAAMALENAQLANAERRPSTRPQPDGEALPRQEATP